MNSGGCSVFDFRKLNPVTLDKIIIIIYIAPVKAKANHGAYRGSVSSVDDLNLTP